MKKITALALSVFALSAASAYAESHVVYKPGAPVANQVYFADAGYVDAKDTCVGADGQLKAPIAPTTTTVCDASYIDRSDSTHPVTVCTAPRQVTTPAQAYTAPMVYAAEVCTQKAWEPNENGYMVEVCKSYARGTVTQNLTYTVEVYDSWDYRHENGTLETRTISACAK